MYTVIIEHRRAAPPTMIVRYGLEPEDGAY